ncbi:MAG: S4 domain-containing protein YaaA [Erysipelotrichales bacterium]
MNIININTDYINLAQFLKLAAIVGSGGEAKIFLAEIDVFVNGELEDRRGRKLYDNDVVNVHGEDFIIKCI